MGHTSWLNPEFSLELQLQQEMDRRKAAHLTHDELSQLADKLLIDWYRHELIIAEAAKHIIRLETQLALAQLKPSKPEPEPRHMQWARELLGLS